MGRRASGEERGGEVTDWTAHTPEQLMVMHDHLIRLEQLGVEAIEE